MLIDSELLDLRAEHPELTEEQLASIRLLAANYAMAAGHDSSVFQEAWDICQEQVDER